MTLDRRRRRNSDIFDTGPIAGYARLGLPIEEQYGQKSPGQSQDLDTSTPSQGTGFTLTALQQLMVKAAEFNNNQGNGATHLSAGSTANKSTDIYQSYTTHKYAGGIYPSKKYMFAIYDPNGTLVKVILGSDWVSVSAAKKKFIDDRAGTAFVPNQESVDAGLVADKSSIEATVWSYDKGLIEYSDAYNTLNNEFSMSDNDINDLLTAERASLIDSYEETRSNALADSHNPQQPENPWAEGEYVKPNVGNATMADQPVVGAMGDLYWDGNLSTHNWDSHGISTTKITSVDSKKYPKPICDPIGGYAMCISHYIADYDNSTGDFRGFRALSASEAEGGVPAGIPIATVVQMFTKPATSLTLVRGKKKGTDFPIGAGVVGGANFFLDTEVTPIWREAIGMPMSPESFFLLEPELATENKITKITTKLSDAWSIQQSKGSTLRKINASSAANHNSVHANGTKSIFPSGVPRQNALNRQFGGVGWGNYRIGEKSKLPFAAKVEWLGEDGAFGEFSRHPPNIEDCNSEGKTMVVYRFPRQLDPVADREDLNFYSANGLPDYSFERTKYCYPHPGSSADKDDFALLGRLRVGSATEQEKLVSNSDTIGGAKYATMVNGETFTARQSIKFVPMVSPSLPPEDRHRPYMINNPSAMRLSEAFVLNPVDSLLTKRWTEKMDRICFDTTSISGASIAVADPRKTAYFNNSKISNAYFIDEDFNVGSTAFAIGQCMLSYEIDSASVDTQLGIVDSSERMIVTTLPSNITSEEVGFRSDKLVSRNPRDGSAAGTRRSDYLPPTVTMTASDLGTTNEPVGMLTVKETFKKIFGYELTPEWFATLNLPNQDPNNPTRYIVDTTYGRFSYPYSIVGFTIPGYYVGPVLAYNEEGNPIPSNESKPGYIGSKNTYIMYQSPFGQLKKHTINFSKEIKLQQDIEAEGGTVTDVLENQTDSESGEFGESYEDVTQEKQKEIQFEEWLKDRLMQDYGNVRFTDTAGKAYFKWWNKDYVTGKMFLENDLPLPGIDLAPYYAEAEAAGIPIFAETTEAESQEQQSVAIAGLGAFTDPSGFTVTDVTAKWGETSMAKARYTGDIGMSMVPYKANVTNEQLGYLAMSNLDGIENPTNVAGIGSLTDDTGTAIKYAGAGAGVGAAILSTLGGISILLPATALTISILGATKSAKRLSSLERKAKKSERK